MSESELTEAQVIAEGGWHPRYAQVLVISTHGDFGVAIVDGNGDGAELEIDYWNREDGSWEPSGSAGAGGLDGKSDSYSDGGYLIAEHREAWFAHGVAHGVDQVEVQLGGSRHLVPVGRKGVWALVLTAK